jgi:hypothetical protein
MMRQDVCGPLAVLDAATNSTGINMSSMYSDSNIISIRSPTLEKICETFKLKPLNQRTWLIKADAVVWPIYLQYTNLLWVIHCDVTDYKMKNSGRYGVFSFPIHLSFHEHPQYSLMQSRIFYLPIPISIKSFEWAIGFMCNADLS